MHQMETQTSIHCSNEIISLCKQNHTSILKHHRNCSLWFQLNDTAATHPSIHRRAKSGSAAELFDDRILDHIHAKFQAEVRRIQAAHPQAEGKWNPSRGTLSKLERGVTIMQPVFRKAIRAEDIRAGAKKAGLVIRGSKDGIVSASPGRL